MIHPIFTYVLTTAKKNFSAAVAFVNIYVAAAGSIFTMLLHTCSNKSMLPPVTFSLGFVSVYVKFPNMSTYDLSPLQHQKGRKIPAEITIHIV